METTQIPEPQILSSMLEFGRQITDEERRLLLLWEKKRADILKKSTEPIEEPVRWKLPSDRESITHRFEIANATQEIKGYLVMGMYPETRRLGEVYLTISKEGSLLSGVMDQLTRVLSIALQHGVPLTCFTNSFKYCRFEPYGSVKGAPEHLRNAASVLDYLGKFLEYRCPNGFVPSTPPPIPENKKELLGGNGTGNGKGNGKSHSIY